MKDIERGILAPQCEIVYYPPGTWPGPDICRLEREVVVFRGSKIADSEYGRLRDSEVASAKREVDIYLLAEELMDLMGLTLPSDNVTRTYSIPNVGTLHVSLGSQGWIPERIQSVRDGEGDVFRQKVGGYLLEEEYAIPSVWVFDPYGKWQRMDHDKACGLMRDQIKRIKIAVPSSYPMTRTS